MLETRNILIVDPRHCKGSLVSNVSINIVIIYQLNFTFTNVLNIELRNCKGSLILIMNINLIIPTTGFYPLENYLSVKLFTFLRAL